MKESRNPQQKKIAVIGAGIAGLAAAYYLKKHGFNVDVLEREAHAGGVVRTLLRDERYLVELGPNAFLASAEPLIRLSRELSIDRLVVGNEALSAKRYIFRHGRLHELPTGPGSFLKSRLLSMRGKMRFLAEPFIRSKSPDSETLADFVTRRGGKEILDALVDPFASGVWAGDPRELEIESVLPQVVEAERECGSVMRGMKKLSAGSRKRGLFSYRWGMGTLTARLEEVLKGNISLGTTALRVERDLLGHFKVRLDEKMIPIEADAVLIAAPAPAAAKILGQLDPKIYEPLSAIPYAPLAILHTAFLEKDLPRPLDGFGMLIPRKEGIRLLGSIWSSSLFPMRCPKGEALLTNFIGGATDPGLTDLSDGEIVEEVMKGLRISLKLSAEPRFTYLKRWGQSIPQYTIGHRSRLEEINARLDTLPGVFMTGSYMAGVSVSDTIAHARSQVDKIKQYLRKS